MALAELVARRADDETGSRRAGELHRWRQTIGIEIAKGKSGLLDKGVFGLRQTRRFFLQRQELAHLG
jgi:hypothetical protein